MQSQSNKKMCKAHPQQKAYFYIINEPWNKLCQQCALNLALCGYKIEKDLSPQEYENKIVLATVIQELKQMIQVCDKNSKQNSQICDKINKQLSEFAIKIVKQMDQHIQQLNKIRNQVLMINTGKIRQRISHFHDIQNRYFIDYVSFKKMLEKLQANYSDIINAKGNNGQQNFTVQINAIKEQIQKTRKYIKNGQISKHDQFICQIHLSLKEKLKQFQSKSIFINNLSKIQGQDSQSKQKQKEKQNLEQFESIELNKKKITLASSSKGKLLQDNRISLNSAKQQKGFYSHRKKSSSTNISRQNVNFEQKKLSMIAITPFPQFTQRTINLTLKGPQRSNSITKKIVT